MLVPRVVRWGPLDEGSCGTTRKNGYCLFIAQGDIDTTAESADLLTVHLTLCSSGSFSGEPLQSVKGGKEALEEKYFLNYKI